MTGKKVLVFGTGISGIAAADLLIRHHAEVVIYDGNDQLKEEDIRAKSKLFQNTQIVLGDLDAKIKEEIELVVLSPGVPTDLPVVKEFQEKDIPIWGEVELAYFYGQGDVLAITGTNGKTTTTALLGEIMKHVKEQVQVVGNIGIPYTSVADEMTKETVTVAEISSYQLETIHEFCPAVSAILNITPDHLNRHHTMENYIATKRMITKNQTASDWCILNYEDEVLRKSAEEIKAQVIFFSSAQELEKGIYLKDDVIYWADEAGVQEVCHIDELQLIGRHNYENVMAAAAMAHAYGIPFEKIKEVLVTFTAVEHRIEYVTTKRGVRFYNDSKGTNPDAAIQALKAMKWKTCLIGGGYDKQSEYDEWIKAFDGKVKQLVLIGQTREKIAETAKHLGFLDYVFADSLEEAIEICYENAESGDAVLLSPACASWGMFDNFEQRGEMFKKIVWDLKE